MRNLIIVLALVLSACSTSRVSGPSSPPPASAPASTQLPQSASIDSVRQFLLAAAASDFHVHGPSRIAGFREVRLRHSVSSTGERMYLLCGQFLREQEGGKAEWIPFATIKTSGYEQYIGATGFCRDGAVEWDDDLSPLLQARLDSLK